MAVAMFMRWSGVTADQYDTVMARLELDSNPAAGGVLHVAATTEEGLEVCDVWQTEQAFRGFYENRFLPVARELQFAGEPEYRAGAAAQPVCRRPGNDRPDRHDVRPCLGSELGRLIRSPARPPGRAGVTIGSWTRAET